MRLWDHLWTGILVSLVMGIILIGGGAFFWAWNAKLERQKTRFIHEKMTGVKMLAADEEQMAREWNRDFRDGALVGGVIWLMGNVAVFGTAWKNRGRGSQGETHGSPQR
jgi:hypothetical protein